MAINHRIHWNQRLVVSADGKWLAGKSNQTLRVWNVGGPEVPARALRFVKTKSLVYDFALSADGLHLVGVGSTGLSIWKTSGGGFIHSGKHRRTVKAVACSPTKPMLVTGDNAGQVFLWDYSGNILTGYDWQLGEVCGLCFAPDGLRCAVVDKTGKVVIWDVDV